MSGMREDDEKLSRAMGLHGKYPPFVELLGVTFEPVDGDNICIKLAMREELSLNRDRGILHGGVISALIDMIGGSLVVWKLREEVKGQPLKEQARRLSRVSTIDLRIDYLRQGKGRIFTATGSVMRTGRKIAVARMELHNEDGLLIATGTGTYTAG